MLTLIAFSMALIAAAQCFHVFKLYTRIVAMEMILNSISTQISQEGWMRVIKEKEEPKKPGANRAPRTDEQKLAASQRRKEWWDKKKKALETKVPNATELLKEI